MNEFERHVFTLPRLARPRHAHDTLAHTHSRAPCSRTNALCKLCAELDRVFARLRPHKVDSASEPPSLPFRHVLCPRTPPSHGTCSRMRPCLTTVCLDIPCGGAGQGGPAAQASTTCVWSPHNWSHACYNSLLRRLLPRAAWRQLPRCHAACSWSRSVRRTIAIG